MMLNARQRRDRDHDAGRHRTPDPDCFGCAYTESEAYSMVSGEMYATGEIGYQKPDDVLATLEPAIVDRARRYAEERDLPWPPRPSGVLALFTNW